MRRNSGPSFRNSGAYTSPGTPEYGDHNVGELPKAWSSERVPLPTSSCSSSSSRRHVTAAAALMPFNGGRALPSKWDDAERWITSPISGYGAFNTAVVQPQRRPKSKSGPLGQTGLVYLPSYSPTMPAYDGRNMRSFVANSPLTTGVLVPDGLTVHYEAGIGARSNSLYAENSMTRSTSVPGLSDLLSETSLPNSQDDKLDGEAPVSRRDMATQMSHDGSSHSSSKGRLSFSALPSTVPTSQGNHAGKDEIRDVQVDKGTTTTARQLKKQKAALRKTDLTNVVDELPSAWDIAEASKNMSKLQREEAKITAWENLQKAKAEAAIRKLEMKLERRRSSSMDKITNKLRAAQLKAQCMRNLLSNQAPRASSKGITYRIFGKLCTVCNCFICGNR